MVKNNQSPAAVVLFFLASLVGVPVCVARMEELNSAANSIRTFNSSPSQLACSGLRQRSVKADDGERRERERERENRFSVTSLRWGSVASRTSVTASPLNCKLLARELPAQSVQGDRLQNVFPSSLLPIFSFFHPFLLIFYTLYFSLSASLSLSLSLWFFVLVGYFQSASQNAARSDFTRLAENDVLIARRNLPTESLQSSLPPVSFRSSVPPSQPPLFSSSSPFSLLLGFADLFPPPTCPAYIPRHKRWDEFAGNELRLFVIICWNSSYESGVEGCEAYASSVFSHERIVQIFRSTWLKV